MRAYPFPLAASPTHPHARASLIPTVNGNTVRSFSTHGHQSAAQGSPTTVSRSDIRLIQYLDSSALGLVRRWRLIGYFPIHLSPSRAQVYGVLWNPFAENEFVTYGVKHLVTWRLGPDPNNPSGVPRWQSIAGTFGPTKIENVLAAAYVPDCMDKYRVRH
jgi:hypothetical protein